MISTNPPNPGRQRNGRERKCYAPPRARRRTAAIGALAAACACLALAACTASSPPASFAQPSPATTPGDLDDVLPACEAVLWKFALTLDGPIEPAEQGQLRYLVLDQRGRPGELTATRNAQGEIELTLRVGRFGDPELEQRALDALRARLRQLEGTDAAPITD